MRSSAQASEGADAALRRKAGAARPKIAASDNRSGDSTAADALVGLLPSVATVPAAAPR
jgi:hypothetical protein